MLSKSREFAGKTEYTATHSTINHVHLEKKSLGDIIPKSADAPVANEKVR